MKIYLDGSHYHKFIGDCDSLIPVMKDIEDGLSSNDRTYYKVGGGFSS